jgi:hypothetical protein|uniref:Uncharacterized protein n=1 Tax=viral metagenome TaxID=1070528 RepID=A0A6C0BJR9_9ZZZZ
METPSDDPLVTSFIYPQIYAGLVASMFQGILSHLTTHVFYPQHPLHQIPAAINGPKLPVNMIMIQY